MSAPARTRTAELELALRGAAPYCDGDPRFTSESRAELEEAASECAPKCEHFSVCRASALHEKPAWGAHGGIVWVAGKQLHLRRKDSVLPLDPAV